MSSLVFNDINKSFLRTDSMTMTTALKNVSFSINDGEFVSIVGPSGCGKSTILRLIAGLIEPSSGEILLDGELVHGTDSNRGMVFQKPTLFPWLTVRENVAFSGKMKNNVNYDRVDELLEKVELADFKDAYPHQLSGGMAQRVALIRTMINEPGVFLLDEPLGALDAFTRMNMQDELLNLWKENNTMMIMVTHDIDEAIYMSNRVIVMKPRPGEIKEIVSIDMDYPRDRTHPKFTEYRNQILNILNI